MSSVLSGVSAIKRIGDTRCNWLSFMFVSKCCKNVFRKQSRDAQLFRALTLRRLRIMQARLDDMTRKYEEQVRCHNAEIMRLRKECSTASFAEQKRINSRLESCALGLACEC
ncbi:MAG: hypothetical protein V1776_05200 [Candidatus Diapherotrites archaeon]